MIPCSRCNHQNPMGTVFCHSCGTRLVVVQGQVMASVKQTDKAHADAQIKAWGKSAVSLSAFLVIAVLCVRILILPAMPAPDLPRSPILDPLLGPQAWAKAAPGPRTKDVQDFFIDRLGWRMMVGPTLLAGLGVDRSHLAAWQRSVEATQLPNGSFKGGEAVAATALAVLALQAQPGDDVVDTGARLGRHWLLRHIGNLGQSSALGRALALCALADAGALTGDLEKTMERSLTEASDPETAVWQAMCLELLPQTGRPPLSPVVRAKLPGPTWDAYAALLTLHEAPNPALFDQAKGVALTTATDRMMWAYVAWQYPYAAKDLTACLTAWSRNDPMAASPALITACGANASKELAILIVAAPMRTRIRRPAPPMPLAAPQERP